VKKGRRRKGEEGEEKVSYPLPSLHPRPISASIEKSPTREKVGRGREAGGYTFLFFSTRSAGIPAPSPLHPEWGRRKGKKKEEKRKERKTERGEREDMSMFFLTQR